MKSNSSCPAGGTPGVTIWTRWDGADPHLWSLNLQSMWPVSWAGSPHCLWLSSEDVPCSWHLQHPGVPTATLLTHTITRCLSGAACRDPHLATIAWYPKVSFEISVGTSMTPQLLHSACVTNQHQLDGAKVCCQPQAWSGSAGRGHSSLWALGRLSHSTCWSCLLKWAETLHTWSCSQWPILEMILRHLSYSFLMAFVSLVTTYSSFTNLDKFLF
jgi:hypothetical protein